MTDRRTENARTLASLLKIETEEAARLLNINIAITCAEADNKGLALATMLRELLERTVTDVRINGDLSGAPAVEITIGSAASRFSPSVRVNVSPTEIQIGNGVPLEAIWPGAPQIALLLAAGYAAGMSLKIALGKNLPVGGPSATDGLHVSLRNVFGPDMDWVNEELELTDTYLAGAGAIGNGFLYALQHFRVCGSLVIVDPDDVSDGNLNRCVFFTDADLEKPKANRLAELASAGLPSLKLIPEIKTLQELGKEQSADAWLKRLIVGVDSRRTRRHLQAEIPREVFDASTTGAIECVLHHHQQPTEAACLACIYHETVDELARERHIAEALGVGLVDVKQHYISSDAARRIHVKYPDVPMKQIEGNAYDSLFKALCSEQKLLGPDNRQVLAPFAFVSVLAGTYLAIEVARRLILGDQAHTFNYWRFSPWAPPVEELKQTRPRNSECEFCREKILLKTARDLWEKEQ